jgi:hypothetical protein
VFKYPPNKRTKSLERIKRNAAIYCVVFDRQSPLDVLVIYEIPMPVMLAEADRKLDVSSNDISHLSFPIKWAQQCGKVVYSKPT